MAPYSTPGVYVEEISTFPPSVAEVSTAIPAFIGYTEKGSSASEEPQVSRINTMLEYETLFGQAQASNYTVNASSSSEGAWVINELTRSVENNKDFLMYYALSLYFKNGGGSCYIISIGNHTDSHEKGHFEKGLLALEKEDEPTLIVCPDSLQLASADYYSLYQEMLKQCGKLGDRFAILDVAEGDNDGALFRGGTNTSNLMYGAAYLPHLQTALSYRYSESEVSIEKELVENPNPQKLDLQWEADLVNDNGIDINFTGIDTGTVPSVQINKGVVSEDLVFTVTGRSLKIGNGGDKTGEQTFNAWQQWVTNGNATEGFSITENGDGSANIIITSSPKDLVLDISDDSPEDSTDNTMAALKDKDTALYNQLKIYLNAQRVILPPSSAIAGIYARVDRNRGVWKSPANESLASVIAPAYKITNEDQGKLNIDSTAGKSINVIRAFTGKGTLVWGARTLAGNDNEWRYISVRRLFNMIEESSQKSTAFAVFEPNDATTWLKVKAMIESFLFSLWERGALAGPTAETAYFVNVGLGKTMTPQDILEGRMNVEIGIAAVRPAEFIILKFSHKLQEA